MRTVWLVLLLSAVVAAPVAAEEVRGKVTQVLAEAVYVDVGSSQGLAAGDAGEIRRVDARIADVAAVTVSGSQARLSIIRSTRRPVVGDEVVLRVRGTKAAEPEAGNDAKSPPDENPFEPLLERQKHRAEVVPERNIFHGRVSFQELFQTDGNGDLDYSISLLSSDGMLDRISGSRWSLRWSGNLFYRTGSAFENSSFDGGQLLVYDLAFARPLGDGGFLRLGRFLPRALSSAGYIDGVDLDVPVGENVRLGAALGFKPTRIDLTPSLDEPTGLFYTSYKAGRRDHAYASGSYGVLVSAWEGALDRTALLLEQTAELGKVRLDATATIDLDVGGAEYSSGANLTQLNAYLSWTITSAVTLRGGTNHWERLDTAAERDALLFLDPLRFDDGYWRTWIGAAIVLPARLRLDLEYDSINSDVGPSTTPWRVTLEHFDPFGIPGANVSLTVYSLEGFEGDGYGGLFNSNFPLAGGRWMVGATAGFRYFDTSGIEIDVTDIRLNVNYAPGGAWQLSGGVQWLGGTALDSLLVDFRVDFRF